MLSGLAPSLVPSGSRDKLHMHVQVLAFIIIDVQIFGQVEINFTESLHMYVHMCMWYGPGSSVSKESLWARGYVPLRVIPP